MAQTNMVVVVAGKEVKDWLRDRFFDICVIAGVVMTVWQFMLAMGGWGFSRRRL
uniref:Uncharacterized protein n=1 Tax=viral metagenome TaxID=1070528 RepID=A0A6M3JI36_9ZZZZ